MPLRIHRLKGVPHVLAGLLLLGSAPGWAAGTSLPAQAGVGPNPALPAPESSLIPTVNIAPAQGWPAGQQPTAMAGLRVTSLASGLDHPRWVHVLPNGDVLVAESNAPPKPEDSKGVKGWAMKIVMGRAGAGVPSANRITLLRGVDAKGQAQTRTVFLENLNSPFGMALVGQDFYVATSDAVLRFPYETGQTRITAAPVKVMDLPAGPINHHWTKNIIASPDGSKLYVTVGSNSNAGERGVEAETGRAAIWELDPKTGQHRIFASGLRNPNGMGWAPGGAAPAGNAGNTGNTGNAGSPGSAISAASAASAGSSVLWTVVNERDEIGDDLVPDYLTSVKDGAFYGWPYSYYGQHVDERVKPPRPDLVAQAIAPDYALGSHVAPLGLVFAQGKGLLPALRSGAFVGEHGSWNRKELSGYKVVFVPFADGQPAGLPVDVLTGFLSPEGRAYGRPVGVALDKSGALLVADDVGNVIWRVSAVATSAPAPASAPVPAPAP